MRFFATNYLFNNFGGSSSASSATGFSLFVFDEDTKYNWTSQGENTDGDAIFVERILLTPSAVNRIFVQNTNINNLTIEVDIGSGYVPLNSASAFTLVKSLDGSNYFYELNSSIAISKIRLIGSTTIVANKEKEIGQCLAFMELGKIAANSDIQPKRERIQVVSKLNSGKCDIINKGRFFSFKLKLKSHYKLADNPLIETILQRDAEMWLWINDNQETSITMIQEPYRFKDIYKVAFQKSDSVQFAKNVFFSGIDVDFDLVEVA